MRRLLSLTVALVLVGPTRAAASPPAAEPVRWLCVGSAALRQAAGEIYRGCSATLAAMRVSY